MHRLSPNLAEWRGPTVYYVTLNFMSIGSYLEISDPKAAVIRNIANLFDWYEFLSILHCLRGDV